MERGDDVRSDKVLAGRYQKIFTALAEAFAAKPFEEDSPHLLHFVEVYQKLFPEEADEVVTVLNELSHGVFADAGAGALWTKHYLAALRLDMEGLGQKEIQEARDRWRTTMKDPAAIYRLAGPQLRCEVKAVDVLITAFGESSPLLFDLNTAPPGMLRLVPGITEAEVKKWIETRSERPFSGVDDFRARVPLNPAATASMKL